MRFTAKLNKLIGQSENDIISFHWSHCDRRKDARNGTRPSTSSLDSSSSSGALVPISRLACRACLHLLIYDQSAFRELIHVRATRDARALDEVIITSLLASALIVVGDAHSMRKLTRESRNRCVRPFISHTYRCCVNARANTSAGCEFAFGFYLFI